MDEAVLAGLKIFSKDSQPEASQMETGSLGMTQLPGTLAAEHVFLRDSLRNIQNYSL
jgi:hypothetical protein